MYRFLIPYNANDKIRQHSRQKEQKKTTEKATKIGKKTQRIDLIHTPQSTIPMYAFGTQYPLLCD